MYSQTSNVVDQLIMIYKNSIEMVCFPLLCKFNYYADVMLGFTAQDRVITHQIVSLISPNFRRSSQTRTLFIRYKS